MKRYTFTGAWVASDMRQVDPALIEQVQDPELSKTERDQLVETIRDASIVELDAQEITELDALYESVKPELKDGDEYQLIACDASRDQAGVLHGILNCRVNGEHVQVRF